MTGAAEAGRRPRLDESARGVFIIAVTPFTPSGEIDWPSLDRLVEFYLDRGVDGLTLLGMMGEAQKLTEAEAASIARHVLGRVAGRVPVVVGVSSPGLRPMAALAAAAMDAGAAALMIAPPSGLRTDNDVVRYFGQAAEAIGAGTPFVLQDFPQANGVHIAPAAIGRIAAEHPGCVVLKHEDWPGLGKITAIRRAERTDGWRRLSILVGNGGMFLPLELARGADGAMTGFAYPELLVQVCRCFADGDRERGEDLFDAYLPLVRYEQQPGIGLAVRKHVLQRRGAIACAATRVPGARLGPAEIAETEYLLERIASALGRIGATLPD